MSGFRYGEFERVQFRKPPFRPLSPFAKLVYLTLVVGPDGTTLPGLVESDAYKLAGDTKLTVEQVEGALRELAQAAMVEVDADHCLIGLVGVPAPAAIDAGEANPKVLVGWWNVWEQLPPSPMKVRHVAALRAACNLTGEAMAAAWSRTFGRVEPDRQPEHQPERQPDHQSDHRSDHQPDRQPEHQPEHQPDPRPDPSIQSTASESRERTLSPLARVRAGQGDGAPASLVVEPSEWRTGLEQRWIEASGIAGFGASGLSQLADLVESAAAAANWEPAKLFDRAVAEFKAWRLTRKSPPPLTPWKLKDSWSDVWERIVPPPTATGPPRAEPAKGRRRGAPRPMGSAPVGDFTRDRDPDEL